MPTKIYLLGHPTIQHEERPFYIKGPSLTLLAYLASEQKLFARAQLAAIFYPTVHARRGRANLSNLMWQLREVLPEALFIRSYHSLGMNWGKEIWVDALDFKSTLRRIAGQWQTNSSAMPALKPLLAQTLALYRGPYIQDIFLTESLPLQEWHVLEQAYYRQLFLQWSKRLVQLEISQQQWAHAATALNRALHHEPLDEDLQMLQLQLLAGQGRRTELHLTAQRFRKRMEKELGAAPSEEYEQLAARLNSECASISVYDTSPAPAAEIAFKVNLPFGQIFGRDEKMERIVHRLLAPGERVLTLYGLGGTGKTALAQTIGARLGAAFTSGACMVSLADVRPGPAPADTRHKLLAAIAAALGIPSDVEATLLLRVQEYLQLRELLLILDNFEHLLEAATLLPELLADAPLLRILVTSRQRLNLASESIELIEGLAAPPTDADWTQVAANPSVMLFVNRCRQVIPDFELTPDNAPAIGEICRAVDGLPLAIELIAHWITLFTPAEIAATIKKELTLFVTPYRDVPARHQSLLIVLTHTWEILSPSQQRILSALSLFQNLFDSASAKQVAGCSPLSLLELSHRALVQIKAPGLYALHPLIKTFAASQGGEDSPAPDRFITHLLQQLHPLDPSEPATGALPVNPSDVAYAWELAVARGRFLLLQEALSAFTHFWRMVGRPSEGIRLLQFLLSTPGFAAGQPQIAISSLHADLATLYRVIGEYTPATQHSKQALASVHPDDHPVQFMRLAVLLGELYLLTAHSDLAADMFQKALACATSNEYPAIAIQALANLATLHWANGDIAQAQAFSRQALAGIAASQHLEPEGMNALWETFNLSALLGDWAQATEIWETFAAWCQDHAATVDQMAAQREMLVVLRVGQHRWQEAYALAQQQIVTCQQMGNQTNYCEALGWASRIAPRAGSREEALAYAEKALQIARKQNLPFALPEAYGNLVWSLIQLGRFHEAEPYLAHMLKLVLAQDNELYTSRLLIAGLLYSAVMRQPALPPPLLARALSAVIASPQSGILTRIEAAEIAQRNHLALAMPDAQAALPPVSRAELQALVDGVLAYPIAPPEPQGP